MRTLIQRLQADRPGRAMAVGLPSRPGFDHHRATLLASQLDRAPTNTPTRQATDPDNGPDPTGRSVTSRCGAMLRCARDFAEGVGAYALSS
jgi:hypothetical protein